MGLFGHGLIKLRRWLTPLGEGAVDEDEMIFLHDAKTQQKH